MQINNTIEECLRAVNDGEATSTYGNSYAISNYSAAGYYDNITVFYMGEQSEIVAGISNKTDYHVRNIISKVIYTLSDNEIKKLLKITQ